jgi:hypothetical protein
MVTAIKAPTGADRQRWNHLKTKALCCLALEGQEGSPKKPLSAAEIAKLIDCDLTSLRNSLPKWCRWRYIRCYNNGFMNKYALTQHGLDILRSYQRGWFKVRRGMPTRFYQVDVVSVMRELIDAHPERWEHLRYLVEAI